MLKVAAQAVTRVSPDLQGRCACVGGCNFFGSNSNGPTFFRPSRAELESRHNVALLTLRDRRAGPGYGQSILHDNRIVLDNCLGDPGSCRLLTEGALPAGWPTKGHQPVRVPGGPPRPPRPGSGEGGLGPLLPGTTPRALRRQRTLGRRSVSVSSTPQAGPGAARRVRAAGVEVTGRRPSRVAGPGAGLQKTASSGSVGPGEGGERHRSAASLADPPAPGGSNLARTESLVSDTLSFYSFDGETGGRGGGGAGSPPGAAVREDGADRPASLSRSVSYTSFTSAVSEQEDFGMVNLHMQVNKPITDSPLLMSSYISHLTQLRCTGWSAKMDSMSCKGPHSSEFYTSMYDQFPCYESLCDGFSSIKMFDKEQEERSDPLPTPSHPQAFTWGSEMFSFDDSESVSSSERQTLLNSLSDSNTSKTTLVVKFRDSIDVIASPILLESLQRYIEAITPTLELLHPLSVINHLHTASLDRVEERNTLKKEKSLDLQDKIVTAETAGPEKKSKYHGQPHQTVSRTFEKSVSSSVQGSLFLPKVNIMILQASVVEEICAFSALDNVKDITCVSFLALGIQETSFKIHKTSQSKKIVQVLSQNNKIPLSKKRKSKYKKIAQLPMGTLAFESSETQLEEIIMTGSINKVHAQLRRLKNDSSLLKDATLTAIPDHRSQVFFEYLNVPNFGFFESDNDTTPEPESFGSADIHPLGFNMCEVGLEGIQVKASKKSSNKASEVKDMDRVKVHSENELAELSSKETLVEEPVETPEIEKVPSLLSVESPGGTKVVKSERKSSQGTNITKITLPEESAEEMVKESKKEVSETNQGKSSKAAANMNVKTVWFNFAAPPKTPISRKIDFTKLDWNLLSTGSPAIDAWLQPFDRIQHAASTMINRYNCRVGAIMASVMAEALDEQQVHFPNMSKYENLTALAKTLKDDPSCQLCSVLKRYVFKTGVEEIEANLDPKVIPALTTLRQGIVVLSRQWKNVIYTPILIEYNMRTSGMKNLYQREVNMNLEQINELEDTSEEEEGFSDIDIDEEALLIKSQSLGRPDPYRQEGSIISNLSFLKSRALRSPHRSPNSDDILALLENGGGMTSVVPGGSIYSDDSGAVRSAKSEKQFSGPNSPAIKKATRAQVGEEEDLYNWMRRQQTQQEAGSDGLEKNSPREPTEKSVHIQIEENGQNERKDRTVRQESSGSGNSFLDAHIIFEPLLSSLGLMPQQITNLSLKNLGSQVVIGGGIDVFKIDIIESEIEKISRKGKVKFPKMTIDPDSSIPAFICEKIKLHVDFKKITDILKGEKPSKDKVLPLYVSRNQLKRHTSSFANFSIEIDIISQKVNMPLLRLINQIVTMHLNVKETSEELKEKKPNSSFKRHKKNSSGSSASEVGSVTLRPDELSLVGSSLNLAKELPGSRLSGPVQTPSPNTTLRANLKSRPKGFASKFRPNSRLGGYSSLGESPMQDQQDSFILGCQPLEKITEEQVTKCWRTIYHLLDLYATLPETKIVAQRNSISALIPPDVSLLQRTKSRYAAMRSDTIKTPDTIKSDTAVSGQDTKQVTASPGKKEVSFARSDTAVKEHLPLIVTGEAKINKVHLTATLSGLRLEGEIRGLGASISYKERMRGLAKVSQEASLSGNMRETCIALLEGVMPSQQTVVRLTVGSTETNYTSHLWKAKDKNHGHLTIGPVHVDIPQHPVTLHGIMTRSTKQITSTLMEFKGTRILYRGRTTTTLDDSDLTQHSSPKLPDHGAGQAGHPPGPETVQPPQEESQLIKPLVMRFSLLIESFAVSAALLPSLQAQYKMENVASKGVTGSKANFNVVLPKHTLSFNTKLEQDVGSDNTIPSEAAIDLPKVNFIAEYIQDETQPNTKERDADGSKYSKGNYFKSKAEIGELDHCLTTDMLNHLVFVQKVFMKEVNEVVQKMSGGDRLVPVWTDFGEEFELHHSTPKQQLLYTVSVELKRITITATTPSNSAVRFETGTSELVLSNRVANVQGAKFGSNKISTKAKIHLKLSLGQLIRDVIYPEAEPQFQQHAYFKTSIQMRNALEDESNTEEINIPDKEVILITLNRPLIFLQPVAVDRAILVWLSYKNAWEYWAEQRSSLNKEVLIATQQVIERVPISQLKEQISSQHIGTLFLQLNVQDIGVAIPITMDSFAVPRDDSKGAIVCTVETTSISACSAASVASKGKFEDLCVRFCEDFNHTLDDWKPDRTDDALLNLCNVSEGSYEVCSKTSKAYKDEETGNVENAKWILNIQWQMTGVEVQVDTDIGKHLTALGHTLTSLAGDEEEESDESSISDELDSDMLILDETVMKRPKTIQIDNLPEFVFDPNIDAAQRTKLMEREMIEQSKTIEDLRKLGASEQTVNQELKKLSDMEAFASKDFRRDIIQKIRRQSARTQSIKEKFGLGSGNAPQLPPQRGISIIKSKAPFLPSPGDDVMDFEESVRSRLESEVRYRSEVGEQAGSSQPSQQARERKKPIFRSRCDTIEEDGSLPSSPGSPRDTDMSKTGSIVGDKVKGTVSPKQQALASNIIAEKKSSEPNVDFEFDFKIFINSGKCVLHTKSEDTKHMKKDKSYHGQMSDNSGSPHSNRKTRHPSDRDRMSISSSRLKQNLTQQSFLDNSTVFFIPGLDVKVHYVSKTESDYEISFITSEKQESFDSNQRESQFLSMTKKGTNKKASLTTWMTLQSIPEETVVTPSILEFLDQAMEPIPIVSKPQSSQDQINIQEDTASDNQGISNLATSSYSSFPVDVIVYFHMKSNRFRFSCQPHSKVECMLTLPSLDLVFSSKRAEADVADEKESEAESEFIRTEKKKQDDKKDMSEFEGGGGLSVTGCLSDFSMLVFHPYGGARKMRRDESSTFSPPVYYEDKKSSLSVNVAFVKFHLSRTRRLTVLHTAKEGVKLPKQSSDPVGKASIRFSTIVDIGKATFSYDMRRLTEILAFPKAWYRRTLVRRLFLGELRTTNIYADIDSPADIYEPLNPLHGFAAKNPADSPVIPHGPAIGLARKSSAAGTPTQKRQSITIMPERRKSSSPPGTRPAQSWETLVLFAIKFKELEVGMNMGNVMGNVLWVSKDFTSDGRLSIGSTGHKNISIGLGLKGSSLEAKGGIIGGCIDIGKIDTYCRVLEDQGVEPQHKLGARLDAMEVRFDYMGTSVLMGRVSHLEVKLKDEWKVEEAGRQGEAGSTRSTMIFVFGDLQWDQFQLMISKSTTADLLKIYSKLEEFFVQQFKSSKRVLSILEPWSSGAGGRELGGVGKLGKRSSSSFRSTSSQTVSHHRHWQQVLETMSGLKVKTLSLRLPSAGSILGGTLELSGKHISLACFHGINFKAKSWALFSMKDPFISFNSEAQCVTLESGRATNVVQNLVFSLGMGDPIPVAQHVSMATVSKITLNYGYSPQFKLLSEWFSYAFNTSDLDQVDRFPVLGGITQRPSQSHRDKGMFNQTNEIIFALPCLRMDLKTDHLQGERAPCQEDPRPNVVCSFVTEFEDHIFVTVDAEAFFFLHDLVSGYMRERERFQSTQTSNTSSLHSPHMGDLLNPDAAASAEHRRSPNLPDAKQGEAASASDSSDWRIFECKTWHLEPTVRLQSWAGKKIEPYGVDFILQKLGFSHAKTTIPKWMQRGFMDPLDKILSVIVMNAVVIVSEDTEEEDMRRRKVSNIVSKSDSFGKKH